MKLLAKHFAAQVQAFFEQHLVIERNASHNTVTAYRDALKLFLVHASRALRCSPDQLDYAALDVRIVQSFLEWLRRERKSGPRTRNHRLAALKAFARYVASVAPEHLDRCRKIRELRPAQVEHAEVDYLEEEEVVQLLAATSSSRRDRAILLLLYNTGARVQEIVDLDLGAFHDEAIPFVRLLGKGRKQRTCPLWARTVEALRSWLTERDSVAGCDALFLNSRGQRFSRAGIAYVLRKLADRAGLKPRHASHISPHVLRHTTAMHLLKSGVDITTIAAWLGHAQLSTTHGYVAIDLRMKQTALAAANTLPEYRGGRFPSKGIVHWLEHIGRGRSYVKHGEGRSWKRLSNSA